MARSIRSTAVLAASLTAALLAGCATTGSGGGPGAATADTLTMALTSDPNTFDPAKGSAASDYQVAGLLYETLVRREGDEVLPGLAESWEVSPDGAVFTLRDDVTCSDGTPLTPSIAAASLQRFAGPAAAPSAPQVFGPGGATITADDAAGTMTVQLGAPWSDLLYGLVIPQAGIACSTDEAALQAGQAPGTGPYTLGAAQRGASYMFTARSDYTVEPAYSEMPDGRRPPRSSRT
ncbi:ABC transporter substrate-binding protein [Pseudonocardia nigra]|uniref:ABC transporter substrate-binding protein n=1 Tax=Pseudonocardia nigra TaxID=1921578 RepID=UPI001C5D035C|nr:ABC transporter substrate-binding protein [Pseudonocardia nigra]